MNSSTSLTNTEFCTILKDKSKRIEGDISWSIDEDHSPAVEFRAEVHSESGWPLFVRGSYNQFAGTLTFALILKTVGRIYGLDMGKDHKNPKGNKIGKKHKHSWTVKFRDKKAYVPADITASIFEPVTLWEQFCGEACIEHIGELNQLPPRQEELFQ